MDIKAIGSHILHSPVYVLAWCLREKRSREQHKSLTENEELLVWEGCSRLGDRGPSCSNHDGGLVISSGGVVGCADRLVEHSKKLRVLSGMKWAIQKDIEQAAGRYSVGGHAGSRWCRLRGVVGTKEGTMQLVLDDVMI